MAKRVVWAESAKIGRRLILEYWAKKTGNKRYSQKLAEDFNERIDYLKEYPEIGKQTDMSDIRTTACGHHSIFYLNASDKIVIIGIYDTRRNPVEIVKDIIKHMP